MNSKAIILVAGMGIRLRPLTDSNHKCLTEVNGITILENCLNNMNDIGIKEVLLVIGYLGDKIQGYIGDRYKDITVRYVENEKFDKTNTSSSLLIGLNHLDDYEQLFIFEGDVMFELSILEKLYALKQDNVTVLEPYNPDLDGTFVKVDKGCNVIDWRHKSRQDADFIAQEKYKTVNIHKFSREFVQDHLLPRLKESVKVDCGKEPLENIMEKIVTVYPSMIYGFVLNGQKWFEIDDERDLRIAEKIFK